MTPEQRATRNMLCALVGALFNAAERVQGPVPSPDASLDHAEKFIDAALKRYPALLDDIP